MNPFFLPRLPLFVGLSSRSILGNIIGRAFGFLDCCVLSGICSNGTEAVAVICLLAVSNFNPVSIFNAVSVLILLCNLDCCSVNVFCTVSCLSPVSTLVSIFDCMPVSILTPVSILVLTLGFNPLTVSTVIPLTVALPMVALRYGDLVDFHVVE